MSVISESFDEGDATSPEEGPNMVVEYTRLTVPTFLFEGAPNSCRRSLHSPVNARKGASSDG